MRNKTKHMLLIEAQRNCDLGSLIREQYEQGMSMDDIAEGLGISRLTLREWMANRLNLRVATQRSIAVRDGAGRMSVE